MGKLLIIQASIKFSKGQNLSKNKIKQLGLMDKYLQSTVFFYGGLPNRFSDLQTAHEVCARAGAHVALSV
jgi:hypothetical protein